MIRPVASILAALQLVAPNFGPKHAAALHLRHLAADGDFDPFTLIAFVEHESRWTPTAVGKYSSGEYVGLGQVRIMNYEECRQDSGSAACEATRAALLDWQFNLSEVAKAFVWARGYCRERSGSGDARRWMRVVAGYDAKQGTVCGMKRGRLLPLPEHVRQILDRRRALESSQTASR